MADVEPGISNDSLALRGHAHISAAWTVETIAFEAPSQPLTMPRYRVDDWTEEQEATEKRHLATGIDAIGKELGLTPGLDADQVAAHRRRFAMQNHPDKLPLELQHIATLRMMIANALCDTYLVNASLKARAR